MFQSDNEEKYKKQSVCEIKYNRTLVSYGIL